MANSTPLNVLDPFISDDQNWPRIWTHFVFQWFIWLFERWVLLFSPLAIPMFVCWGVSTAIGVVIQYKITANNLNSGSSLLQFCNCCDRPKPDRWQDTSFFTSDDVKWRHEQVTCSTLFLWYNLTDRNTRRPYVQCSTQAPHPMHITHQPDADKRRDTCSSRATHTIHESNLTFAKASGWSRASRHVFASTRELLTGIVQYPLHVLVMTNDNKRTRNV